MLLHQFSPLKVAQGVLGTGIAFGGAYLLTEFFQKAGKKDSQATLTKNEEHAPETKQPSKLDVQKSPETAAHSLQEVEKSAITQNEEQKQTKQPSKPDAKTTTTTTNPYSLYALTAGLSLWALYSKNGATQQTQKDNKIQTPQSKPVDKAKPHAAPMKNQHTQPSTASTHYKTSASRGSVRSSMGGGRR